MRHLTDGEFWGLFMLALLMLIPVVAYIDMLITKVRRRIKRYLRTRVR